MIWEVLLAFVAMFLLDFFYAEWVKTVGQKKAILASMWAALIMCSTSVVTTSYVHNIYLIIPVIAGAALGTYVSVKRA